MLVAIEGGRTESKLRNPEQETDEVWVKICGTNIPTLLSIIANNREGLLMGYKRRRPWCGWDSETLYFHPHLCSVSDRCGVDRSHNLLHGTCYRRHNHVVGIKPLMSQLTMIFNSPLPPFLPVTRLSATIWVLAVIQSHGQNYSGGFHKIWAIMCLLKSWDRIGSHKE